MNTEESRMKVVSLSYPLLSRQFDPFLKGYVVGYNLKTGRPLIEAVDPLSAPNFRGSLKKIEVDRVTSA